MMSCFSLLLSRFILSFDNLTTCVGVCFFEFILLGIL